MSETKHPTPWEVEGPWVLDANGMAVLRCPTPEMALALVEALELLRDGYVTVNTDCVSVSDCPECRAARVLRAFGRE